MRRLSVAMVLVLALFTARADPVLECAPTPGGPWTAAPRASVAQLADGMLVALVPADAAGRFYRLVDSEGELAHCPVFVRPALEVGFWPGDADSDGDTVPDCADLCAGYDDRIDENGNGIPDDCDIPGMVRIPAGAFQMGDPFGEGYANERPVHTVPMSTFYMERYEVTKGLWDEVRGWATAHGYSFERAGDGVSATDPVQLINWWDAVKWCNARSEREGLVPAYYTSADRTTIYRTGRETVANEWVKWDANGYRLPTEAEWEKAARGGQVGARYPWGDTIDPTRANYASEATTPVGSYPPNGYGLYDMAGNVWEWCWDWYAEDWYGRPEASAIDPRGPVTGAYRVYRGSDCSMRAFSVRCAQRWSNSPGGRFYTNGFRCVRARP